MSAAGVLFERDHELAELGAALEASRTGTGRVVVIDGEAGVGKSRLLRVAGELAREAGMGVLSARGVAVERNFAFGVAIGLLEPFLSALDAAGRTAAFDGPAETAASLLGGRGPIALSDSLDRVYALVHGLRWLVVNLVAGAGGAPGGPLLVAVDDAQWSDMTSLRFLARLAVDIETLPVALVVAVRSGEPETPDVIDDLRATARVLRPAALSEQAVTSLVGSVYPDAAPEFCRACARASAGNPFYLHALLASARADGVPATALGAGQVDGLVPASVLRSVLTRIARLPAGASLLACALAVLGDRAPLWRAGLLAGLDERAAEQAADALAGAHILLPGDPLTFVHPLIGAAIGDDMPAMARSRAHRRAAELLTVEGAPVEAIAAQLLACRPANDPAAVKTLRAAAEQAAGRGEHQAARRFLDRALAEPPPVKTRARVEVELALVEAATGAPDAVSRVAASLDLLDDPRQRAQTLQVLAWLLFTRSDFDGAADAARRAMRELDAADPLARELLIDQLLIAGSIPDVDPRAAAQFAEVLQAARPGRLPTEPGLRALLAGWALRSGEPAARVRELAQAAIADRVDGDRFYGIATGIAVVALIHVDEFDLAEPPIDATLDRARRSGSLIGVGFASHWHAQLRYLQGSLADAIADANQTLEVCRAGWDVCVPWVAPILARAHVDGGDLDAAARALALCDDLDEARVEHAFALDARAHLALARTDPAAAIADFEAAGALAERHGISQPTMLPWRSQAALAAVALGDRERATGLAEAELARARKLGVRRTLGAALRAAGLAAGDRGLPLLTEAVSVLERSPAALERARALADLGAAERRAGHRTAAREPLRRALTLADELGAAPLATTIADELHAAGGRRRPSRHHAGPLALTATERRVAQLAAQGLGTPQIAHTLYVAPKTVEWHLGHIYQKLAIHSRHQLPGALRETTP